MLSELWRLDSQPYAILELAATAMHDSAPSDAALPAGMGARARVGSMQTQPHPLRPIAPLAIANYQANFPSPFHPPLAHAAHGAESASAVGTVAPARLTQTSLEARVDVLERRIIEDCLQRNHQRRKETAAELGISRVTLYNKMKKFGLM